MCAPNNLTAFTYWQVVEPHMSELPIQNFGPPFFHQDNTKNTLFRKSMLFFNNITKPEYIGHVEEESERTITSLHPVRLDIQPKKEIEEIMNDSKVQYSNEKARPHFCEECGKSFLLKHHLTTHIKTHTGVRPHECGHCGKTFAHKHCLNTHLLLHSSERPFKCQECKKSFTLKHHLMTHRKVHNRNKPFICNECGQAFPLKRHLTTHMKFHAGERPFICQDCGESFAQKDHLVIIYSN